MRQASTVSSLMMGLLLLAGCGSDPAVPSDTAAPDEKNHPVPLLDVLFVVDDSSSMCEEHLALADSFDHFMESLTGSGPVDIRLAVTTPNVCGPSTCTDGTDCESGECQEYLGEKACFCSADEDCGSDRSCRIIEGQGICFGTKANRGRFVYHPATTFPPECIQKRRIPCLTDADCQDSPLIPFPGDWHCNPKPEQYLYSCDKPPGFGEDPYPGEILHAVNTRCYFRCTKDEECTAAFGDPRYVCIFPGGDATNAGCMIRPATEFCPEDGPRVLDASVVEQYVALWEAGTWQGLPDWDSLDEKQAHDAIFTYLFNCMANVGAAHPICASQEQGLRAARLALDPTGENAEQALAFHREGAFLLIVVLSDEDDCSTDGFFQFPAIEWHCVCRRDTSGCTTHGLCDPSQPGPLTPVTELADRLRLLKPDAEQIILATIVGDIIPGSSTSPGTDETSVINRFHECKCDKGMYAPYTYSCLSAKTGDADIGSRYLAATEALGGVTWNICSDQGFGAAFEQIATAVLDRIQQAK